VLEAAQCRKVSQIKGQKPRIFGIEAQHAMNRTQHAIISSPMAQLYCDLNIDMTLLIKIIIIGLQSGKAHYVYQPKSKMLMITLG